MSSVLGSAHLLRRIACSNIAGLSKLPIVSSTSISNEKRQSVLVQSTRGAKKWYPDKEYYSYYDGGVYYYPEETKWDIPKPNNSKCSQVFNCIVNRRFFLATERQVMERTVKNMQLNFGPQHPAAHGVLRLVLELDGEKVLRSDPHIGEPPHNNVRHVTLFVVFVRPPS